MSDQTSSLPSDASWPAAEEWNRRALLGEMGEPVPENVVCSLTSEVCDDLRCRHFGCLDDRLTDSSGEAA